MTQPLRMTHQREIILSELYGCQTHPTADELHERIKKKLPRISLATVYRNLEILSAAGFIKKLEISGRQKRFDRDPGDHDHVFCTQCQRIDNIPTPGATALHLDPIREKGYKITGCRVEFFGLCPKCQKQYEIPQQTGECTMACTPPTIHLNDNQQLLLEALAKSKEACNSKELAAATGLETKQISCQITALRNKGYVHSPVRCKYEITAQGRDLLA